MERTLTDFIRAMRLAGAQVSSAEAIDAANTLALIGYEDRQRMKDSLALVLAKSEEEKDIHDKMFETFFRSRGPADGQGSKDKKSKDGKSAEDGEDKSEDQSARSGPQPGGQPSPQDSPGGQPGAGGGEGGEGKARPPQTEAARHPSFMELAQSDDQNLVAVAIERAGAAAGVDEIRFATQASFFVRRMMEQLGVEAFEAELGKKMLNGSKKSQAEAKAMMDLRAGLQRKVREYVDQRFELFGRTATENFMNDVVINREIGQLGVGDMDRMKAVVSKMAKRLAVRHSRRHRARKRGQLDMRHTMRANAGHDGIPFDLVWKHKRKDRPKIVAICDVSGSVSRYVRFLLLFLYALKDEVADLGTFAFSARLKDVGRTLDSMSFEAAMDQIVNEVGSGSTDYGQALVDFKDHHWELIDRRTTVLILGDGRSNNADPRLDILQEAADRAKRVVWLSPEPSRRWGTGDSCMLEYQPFCTQMSHCASAIDLERILDEVLMAYD